MSPTASPLIEALAYPRRFRPGSTQRYRAGDRDRTATALDHWAHLAAADILLAGLSSFSVAPELLRAGCVLRATTATRATGYHCYPRDDDARRCVARAADAASTRHRASGAARAPGRTETPAKRARTETRTFAGKARGNATGDG